MPPKVFKQCFGYFLLACILFVAFNMYLETHLRRQSFFFIAERSFLTANKILKLGLYKPPKVEPCYVSSAPRPFNRSQFWESPQSNTNVTEYSIVFNILKVLYTEATFVQRFSEGAFSVLDVIWV